MPTAPTTTATPADLDPLAHPTMGVEEWADLVGVCRSTAYAAVNRGEVPVVRIGRRFRIPTAFVRRQLQLDPEPNEPPVGHEPAQVPR